MKQKTIINLDNIYLTRKEDVREHLHSTAYEDIFKHIYESIEFISIHEKKKHSLNKITDCRSHNVIFIDGERGSGKTTFLVNLDSDSLYKYELENQDIIGGSNVEQLLNKALILPPIDPTLLEIKENILNVIIGLIKGYIDDNNYLQKSSNTVANQYLQVMRKLMEASQDIGEISSNKNIGIDSVLNYENSLKMEEYMHNYCKAVLELTGKELIILRIDDVDMAFERGFDILEVLRKYTSSPYILPIVTGDIKLYKYIVAEKFAKDIDHKHFINTNIDIIRDRYRIFDDTEFNTVISPKLYYEYSKTIQDFSSKYLEKIFPNNRHIQLPIDLCKYLLDNKILFKSGDNEEVLFKDIIKFIDMNINVTIGNPICFQSMKLSNNTRFLFGYLYVIIPYYYKYLKDKHITLQDRMEFLKKTFSYFRSIDEYKNLLSYMKADINAYYYDIYRPRRILQYNSLFYDKKIKERLISLRDEHIFMERSRRMVSERYERAKLLMYITKKDYNIVINSKDKANIMNKMIMTLFIKEDRTVMYNSIHFVVVGRLIDLIFSSFGKISSRVIGKILSDNPKFIVPIPPKIADMGKHIGEEEDDDDNQDIQQNIADVQDDIDYIHISDESIDNEVDCEEREEDIINISNFLYKHILLWYEENKVENSIINVLFLKEVLDKFYSNLYKLKEMKINGLLLINYLQRIVYILLNSVAYVEQSKRRVTNKNIATHSKTNNINIEQSDVYKINILPFIKEGAEIKDSITYKIFSHPIVTFILNGKIHDEIFNMDDLKMYVRTNSYGQPLEQPETPYDVQDTEDKSGNSITFRSILKVSNEAEFNKILTQYIVTNEIRNIVSNLTKRVFDLNNKYYSIFKKYYSVKTQAILISKLKDRKDVLEKLYGEFISSNDLEIF